MGESGRERRRTEFDIDVMVKRLEELYAELRAEGIDVGSGAFGENFTTRGVDLNALEQGDRLRVGDCLIEITDVRVPCNTLKKVSPKLPRAIVGRSGWVAKVVEEAVVKAGDAIERLPRLQELSS